MNQSLLPLDVVVDSPASTSHEPILLVELEPRHQAFFNNLKDLLFPRRLPPLRLVSWPAEPWPDVLIKRRLPWWGWAESVVLHIAVAAAILAAGRIWPPKIQVEEARAFTHQDVIYYDAAEYLPPIDTGGSHVTIPQQGEPAYAPQPIISVPPEADNPSQTIVTPPDVKLPHDVPLPNMVAWSAAQPSVPLAATARTAAEMRVPAMAASVVAPPPQVQRDATNTPAMQQAVVAPPPDITATSRRELQAPQTAAVAPPPRVENAASIRRMGDINIGHSAVVAPAPQLPMGEQHAATRVGPSISTGGGPAVVPPPPSVQGSSTSGSGGGQIISLSVRPAAPNASEIPSGNRRGSFAATPEGKPGAAGTPNVPGNSAGANSAAISNGAGKSSSGMGSQNAANGVPPGLYVGAAPKPAEGAVSGGQGTGAGTVSSTAHASDQPALMAKATPPRVAVTAPSRPAPAVYDLPKGDLDRQVFGGRKYYSMMVSMPNLTSAGGSWVIRFAELNKAEENAPNAEKSDLSAPIAIRQLDPKYPLEVMRQNVQGTVTLYAIIHSDGSVSDVRVLRGVDDRIDEYAREALAGWQFRPGTKDGTPVDIEAVVAVPFKPMRMKPSF